MTEYTDADSPSIGTRDRRIFGDYWTCFEFERSWAFRGKIKVPALWLQFGMVSPEMYAVFFGRERSTEGATEAPNYWVPLDSDLYRAFLLVLDGKMPPEPFVDMLQEVVPELADPCGGVARLDPPAPRLVRKFWFLFFGASCFRRCVPSPGIPAPTSRTRPSHMTHL